MFSVLQTRELWELLHNPLRTFVFQKYFPTFFPFLQYCVRKALSVLSLYPVVWEVIIWKMQIFLGFFSHLIISIPELIFWSLLLFLISSLILRNEQFIKLFAQCFINFTFFFYCTAIFKKYMIMKINCRRMWNDFFVSPCCLE